MAMLSIFPHQDRARPASHPRPPRSIKDEMGQLEVTIYELGQLDLDNRTEYTTNIDIVKMVIFAYSPVRENRMHFRRQDIEYSKSKKV